MNVFRQEAGVVRLLRWAGFLGLLTACGCGGGDTKPPDGPPAAGFPTEIGAIMGRSCATSGCHTADGAALSSGLDLSSWQASIRGSENGEVFIPFHSGESHLIDHLTGEAEPRMPLSRDPLPEHEIDAIQAWIDAGARSESGEVPYAGSQRKIYVANQGSDQVSVLDLDALVTFRIVTVGSSPNLEGPHNIWLDGPKRYWYVTLINSGELWQYDAATDAFRNKVEVGASPANGVTSADGSRVYVTNWEAGGSRFGTVRVVDAATMTVVDSIQVGGRPHGIAISPDGTRLYTTNYYTDDISVVDLTLPRPAEIGRLPVSEDDDPTIALEYQPNEAILSHDGRYIYVALFQQNKQELRVVDTHSETVAAVIPTGGSGFLEDLRPDGLELYVADWGSNTVSVIDPDGFSLIETLTDPYFSKPHGVAFSPDGRFAFVTNENRDGTAPEHHPTQSGGRRGNLTVIDTATRRVVKVIELEPVSAGIAVLD